MTSAVYRVPDAISTPSDYLLQLRRYNSIILIGNVGRAERSAVF